MRNYWNKKSFRKRHGLPLPKFPPHKKEVKAGVSAAALKAAPVALAAARAAAVVPARAVAFLQFRDQSRLISSKVLLVQNQLWYVQRA